MNSEQDKSRLREKWLLKAAIFIVAILIISIGGWYISRHYTKSVNQYQEQPEQVISKPTAIPPPSENTEKENLAQRELTLPESAEISMWFASQAPYADWSEPWQNACEEAAIIIVKHYLDQDPLNKEKMYDEVLRLVEWQHQNWGENRDLTSEETVELAEQSCDLKGEVIYHYNIESIKELIVKGVPVIVPTDGRKLNNPNFRNGGPAYHMLVLKGYDTRGNFITNDPGTRLGEGYLYPYDIVLSAVKNPSGGEKSIFVLYK